MSCLCHLSNRYISVSADPGFRVRVRALEDVYAVLAKASKAVQRTQALPWERQAGQEEVLETLRDMRLALIASHKKTPSTSELLIVTRREELWPSLLKGQPLPPVPEVSIGSIGGLHYCYFELQLC